jgi:drug/metabolite transporter (DMT)-like permease
LHSILNKSLHNWLIFSLLSLIWGSSFVLMIKGLQALTAFQVASIRIILSGIVLLPFALRAFKELTKSQLAYVFLSGLLGSLLPAYLFCIAETKIDSSFAGSLNALTPIFVIVMGALFFGTNVSTQKIVGIAISFVGSVLLFLLKSNKNLGNDVSFVSLVVIATILYGINVNMVGKHLKNVASLHIASVALVLNAIPAVIVLIATGYFSQPFFGSNMLKAAGYTAILGIAGTAGASILFYRLVKSAGMVFASTVTYAIPIVAVGWGLVQGEQITFLQIGCLCILLLGVYIANSSKS